MSNPFERLDSFVLDRVAQPAANGLSHRLGLDHFAVARGLLQASAVASLAFAGAALAETPRSWVTATVTLLAMKIPGLLSRGIDFAWTVDGISILCLTAAVYLGAANLPPPPATSTQSAWRDAMATGAA